MIQQRLPELLNDLLTVIEKFELKVSDEVVFQESCSFLRGELANANRKDWKKPNYNSTDSPSVPTSSNLPNIPLRATERQIEFLLKNSIDVNTENLTKTEAHRLIGEFKKKQHG